MLYFTILLIHRKICCFYLYKKLLSSIINDLFSFLIHLLFRYNKYINVNDTEALKSEVIRINTEQFVHNLDQFGLSLGSDSLVIIIQTHNRPEHLRMLLDSMRKVKDISKVLLIVSHDVYSHQLNDLVEAVEFCPVSP